MNGDGVDLIWLGAAFILVLLAIVAWIWSDRKRSNNDLSPGEIIYSDHGIWYPQSQPLHSSNYHLVGRPDYLIEEPEGNIIPVELKSTVAPSEPHFGHVLQLAAFCLLVDEIYGLRPPHGVLQYHDKAFAIAYTQELEDELVRYLTEMRDRMFIDELDRDHDESNRCVRCGLRDYCDQRLA